MEPAKETEKKTAEDAKSGELLKKVEGKDDKETLLKEVSTASKEDAAVTEKRLN
jgi:hypothetical protein